MKQLPAIKLLVKNGADINNPSNRALTWAAHKLFTKGIEYLIKSGADVAANNYQCVRLLLSFKNYEVIMDTLKCFSSDELVKCGEELAIRDAVDDENTLILNEIIHGIKLDRALNHTLTQHHETKNKENLITFDTNNAL